MQQKKREEEERPSYFPALLRLTLASFFWSSCFTNTSHYPYPHNILVSVFSMMFLSILISFLILSFLMYTNLDIPQLFLMKSIPTGIIFSMAVSLIYQVSDLQSNMLSSTISNIFFVCYIIFFDYKI